VADPSYDQVSTGRTGHLESIQVAYDPAVTSYAQLLEIYWHNIDPMQTDGQFYDRAPEYHTAIFYANDAERRVAEASRQAVAAKLKKPIATQIRPAMPFYPAEEYHQDFYKKNPEYYHAYRTASGRDSRLKQIWGKAPVIAH
jgi:methionine-S-sulfoxide reductase